LTWSAVANTPDLLGYQVWRRQTQPMVIDWQQKGGLFRQTQVTDLAVENGHTYEYKIRSVDTAGLLSTGSNIVLAAPQDTTAPEPPQNLAASSSATWVELVWRPSVSPDATSYRIERALGPVTPQSTWVVAATVTGEGHTDTGLTGSTEYHYRARCIDDDGNLSLPSNEVTSHTKSTAAPAVDPPARLQARGAWPLQATGKLHYQLLGAT
jgi:hypothetical protein